MRWMIWCDLTRRRAGNVWPLLVPADPPGGRYLHNATRARGSTARTATQEFHGMSVVEEARPHALHPKRSKMRA